MSAPGIRHFEGPNAAKPWHYLCSAPGHLEFRATWPRRRGRARRLIDRTTATRLIRALPGALRRPAYSGLGAWRARR